MPWFIVEGLDAGDQPVRKLVFSQSVDPATLQFHARNAGIFNNFRVDVNPVTTRNDPRLSTLTSISQQTLDKFITELETGHRGTGTPPDGFQPPPKPPTQFERGLESLGLTFLTDPGEGEDITPFAEDRDPVQGELTSLFRTPSLNTLRDTTPEGIDFLEGAASSIGILPSEFGRRVRSVTPSGRRPGSILA